MPNHSWNENNTSNSESSMYDCLTRFININFLSQHINKATHKDGNTLDLVFTNNDNLLHSYDCISPSLLSVSDHLIIECKTILGTCAEDCDSEIPKKVSPLDNLNFLSNDINWEEIANHFKAINWELILSGLTPDEQLNMVMEKIHSICKDNIPLRKTLTKTGKPKIPRDRRILMRKRKKIFDQLKLQLCDARRKKLNRKLVDIEVSLQKSHHVSKMAGETKAIEAIKKNPKYFYSYAKKFSSLTNKVGPLLDENNFYTGSSKKMSEILSKQYESVFSEPSSSSVYADQNVVVKDNLGDIIFTIDDIINAIDELSNNSGSGPDGVPAILLKKCKGPLSEPLLLIWRNCLDVGITPDQLKLAHIVPVFKDGHRGLASNYRPIALTSHLIKVFEKVVRNTMVRYLEHNEMFNNSQHGFRQRRSCLSQLLSHFDKIITRLETNQNVDVIYLDFAKAFDKVDHTILLQKLELLGVNGKLHDWIKSFLLNRTQRVMVNGHLSSPVSVKSGVPQGSVLGPLLFLVLISDIDSDIVEAFLSSFADDTRIGMSVMTEDDISVLQCELNKVYAWAATNNMTFNNNKFELLRYGANAELKESTHYFSSDGSKIETKAHIKDLGVFMSSSGSFSEHINRTCKKARDMCSWILRTFSSRSSVLMMTLWKSLVQPILDYCSQLWCPLQLGQIKQLEEVQKSFTRKIKLDQRLNYWERLKVLRLYSQERRRERYRIIYVWKIFENLAPPIHYGDNGGILKLHARNGRTMALPEVNNKIPSAIKKMRDSSLTVHGANLFNCLPKTIRNLSNCSVLDFKSKLDCFLSGIPDEPRVTGYTQNCCTNSNSLVALVSKRDQSTTL